MKKMLLSFVSVDLFVFLSVASVWATPITFDFTATVESIADSTNILQNSLGIGNTVLGQYTFDDLTTDGDLRATVGSYQIAFCLIENGKLE